MIDSTALSLRSVIRIIIQSKSIGKYLTTVIIFFIMYTREWKDKVIKDRSQGDSFLLRVEWNSQLFNFRTIGK